MHFLIALNAVLTLSLASPALAQAQQGTSNASNPTRQLVEDFESYPPDGLPVRWKYIDRRGHFIPVSDEIMSQEEYFAIKSENGGRFLRAVTMDRAHRLLLSNDDLNGWDVGHYPNLQWDWRAVKLPIGAREDSEDRNDTGGAVYVTFSKNWLGLPKSIKYSYSSTLPVGSIVSFRRLKVIVVSTGADGIGAWTTVRRNVADDYRAVFGEDPPDHPLSVMIWSDSNSVHGEAVVDFDNIMLLRGDASGNP